MSKIDLPAQSAAVRSTLATHGIHPALAMLNGRTQYRYTAIYKLSGGALRAEHVFDRASEYRTWLKRRRPSDCEYARWLDTEGSMKQALSPYDEVTMAEHGVRCGVLRWEASAR
jgi:hypothetical protein